MTVGAYKWSAAEREWLRKHGLDDPMSTIGKRAIAPPKHRRRPYRRG